MKNRFNRYFLLIMTAGTIAVLLVGCYSYKPLPDAYDKDALTNLTGKQKTSLPEGCKVLQLQTAIDIAIANNPDFISTKHAMNAAWARYYQSLSAYLPEIKGSFGIGQDRYYPGHTHGLPPGGAKKNYNDNWNIGIQGQWLIFDGLMRTMNMLAARHTAKQFEALTEDAHRILINAVTNAYNQILLAMEQHRIAQADLDFQLKMVNETQIKFDAGAVPLTDLLNFKIKANDARNYLIITKYSYNNSRYALAELMGLTDGALPDHVGFPKISSATHHLTDIGVYLDTALNNRPDLKSYREALEAAEYNLYSTWGSLSPKVYFNTSYTYNEDRTRYRGHRDNVQPYTTKVHAGTLQYGGQVEWVLFNGGRRFAEIREAQALVAESKYKVADQWLKVISDVRQAYDNCLQSVEQLKLFRETLTINQKNRDLVEEEYKAGNTELTRLNEAQRDLINAQSSLATAIINVLNSKAQLEASTGTND